MNSTVKRFRFQKTIYVYGIKPNPLFEREVTQVVPNKNIIVRNYGALPTHWTFQEYHPLADWYFEMTNRVVSKIRPGQRFDTVAWDILNYHAHTIQLAFKRYNAAKNI